MSRDKIKHACELVVKYQHNISVAESVTAGLIQNVFSNMPKAIGFYEGGITAYNLRQKFTHLKIDIPHAVSCNCVSERVAKEMAIGVNEQFKTKWGLAVTGYASPVPEMNVHELYACYAFSFDSEILEANTIRAKKEEPEEVQQFYTDYILNQWAAMVTNYYAQR